MNGRCPHCGTEYDVEKKEMYRYMKCGACGNGFVAGAAASLQKGNIREASSKDVGEQVGKEYDAAPSKNPRLALHRPKVVKEKIPDDNVLMEEKLRLAIDPKQAQHPHPMTYGSVTAAEERVRMYDEMRRKQARQKMVRNFVESVILLLCLGVVVGCCLWWRSHTNRVEKERIRLQAEAEAERIRQQQERDRLERERREKDRLEREAERAREAERRKKEQEAQARRLAEEREARERAERETRYNKEIYYQYKMAIRENKFDLFTKTVTNGMETAGGELCYLFPSTSFPAPLHLVVFGTNCIRRIFRLEESGRREVVETGVFEEKVAGLEYLVAKGDMVFFRSLRKTPPSGLLNIAKESDPAETYFGALASTLKELKPTYDELTFDIYFTPRGTSNRIFVENLPFGCSWSRRNVREAIEKNTPTNSGKSYGVGSRSKKFKRTVKIWNGAMIKQGVDGITYVPSAPPMERYYETRASGLPNVIYRSRTTVRYDNSHVRWQSLYTKAQQEEAEVAAYYERQRQKSADRRASAQAAEEQRWQEKVDGILSNGVLSYKIRKAKVKD